VSGAWWAGFGPADTSLRCGDVRHRLQWRDGTLQAVDHPDAEAELVLGALGGDTSPCLDLLAAWGKHSDDLTVLAIGPRSASDQLTIPASVLDEIRAVSGPGGPVYHGHGNPVAHAVSIGGTVSRPRPAAGWSGTTYVGRSGSSPWRIPLPARAQAMRRARMLRGHASYGLVSFWRAGPGPWRGGEIDGARAELIRVLALGSPFQFRLSAAVAHAWSADGANAGRTERARPTLTAALAGRLAPSAADWLGIDPDQVEASTHDGDDWGELALTKTDGSDRLTARLPVGWLASVWAPGFAVVDGHLVVSVLDAVWPSAKVLAVPSPGRDPAETTLHNDKGHWSITSR
jgi:hypothetical protein